jgi:hypothetical protein
LLIEVPLLPVYVEPLTEKVRATAAIWPSFAEYAEGTVTVSWVWFSLVAAGVVDGVLKKVLRA